jgi:DNA polymerase-3 subunit beta
MTTIHSKALHRALQIVGPAVNARAVIPILTNVNFSNGRVIATDLELEISTASGLPESFAAINKMITSEAPQPFLSNVLIHNRGGLLRVGGTNGHKLFESGFNCPLTAKALTPASITRALAGLQPTSFAVTEKCIFMEQGAVRIMCRLSEGNIPDFSIFTPGAPANITCNRLELIAAINQATVLKKRVDNALRVDFTADSLKVTYRSQDELDSADVTIQATGLVGAITFNAAFLLDVLNVLGSEQVGILYTDSAKPLHLFDTDRPDVLAMVLPIYHQ